MDCPNGLIISYLALMSIFASGIQCSAMENSSETICQQLPSRDKFRSGYGLGVEVNYRPYILYQDNYMQKVINYTVYKNNHEDNCTFTIEPDRLITTFYPYQVSEKDIVTFMQTGEYMMDIMSIDMSNCTKRVIRMIRDFARDEWNTHYFIHSAQGMDVILSKNENTCEKLRYDLNGTQIGYAEPFEYTYSRSSRLMAMSPSSPSSNLMAYYRAGNKHFLSLLDTNGHLIKHLLELNNDDILYGQTLQDLSDSLYAFCWKQNDPQPRVFHCTQFDEFGNQTYYGNVTTEDTDYIGVRNLKKGGVVLFIFSPYHMRVIEMRPDHIYEKLYHFDTHFMNEHVVSNFNEVERQFTIRMEDMNPKQHQMCWLTFNFPSKSQKDDHPLLP